MSHAHALLMILGRAEGKGTVERIEPTWSRDHVPGEATYEVLRVVQEGKTYSEGQYAIHEAEKHGWITRDGDVLTITPEGERVLDEHRIKVEANLARMREAGWDV